MAREIKDELQAGTGVLPEQAQSVLPQGSLQLNLDSRQQQLATAIVMEDFGSAKQARDDTQYGRTSKGITLNHDKWLEELKDLYFGQRIPKTIPWQFCSNRSLMIAMAIMETLHARLYPATYNEDLVTWRPLNADDAEKSETVSKVMNWWIRVHCKMREFFDRWVRNTMAFGRTLSVQSWDLTYRDKGEMSVEQPITDPMGNPVMNQDGTPGVIPPQKILHRMEKTRSDIIPEDDIFLLKGSTDIQRDTVIVRRKYLYRDLEEMEREGKAVNVTQPLGDQSMLLKNYVIPVGSVSSGESDEEDEAIKNVKRRNVPVEILEVWASIDLDGDTFPEQVRVLIAPQWRLYLGGMLLKDISLQGMRPIDLTLYMPRIDEPQGMRGFGILDQVKELAQEIDAIFNQMTDSNTLMVLRPGFYDPQGDLVAPEMTIAPNRWTPVSNPQQSIYVPEISAPTEKLILSVRLVIEFIEKLTASSAYQFGNTGATENVGGSGTATRTNAIVGAANERHAVPVLRLKEGAARILTQHLDLLQKNFPPGLEDRILDNKNQRVFESGSLQQESIVGEFDCFLMPDDAMGSKETERNLSQMLYAILTQNLLVASDPAKLYKITADVLKAWGKDAELYLGPEPPIRQVKTPEEENALMLQGDFQQVRASVMDNPIQHILVHRNIQQEPAFQLLSPEAQQQLLQVMEAHVQEHIQMLQMVLANAGKGGQGGLIGQQPPASGAAKGTARAASPAEPESGVGGVSNPLAQARQLQRNGESAVPS